MDFIKVPFGYMLEFLYTFTTNYGVALILFSLAIKILFTPFTAKSKKSSMKMSRLQPKLKVLEAACGDDKALYQQETMKLYKEENVSMFGSCLWALIPMLVMLVLYAVIREPLKYLLHFNGDTIAAIKEAAANLQIDTAGYYWQYAAAQRIQEFAPHVEESIAAALEGVKNVNFTLLGIDLGQTPSWKVWAAETWSQVGGFLLPVISGGMNMLSMFVSQRMNGSVARDEKGEIDKEAAQKMPGGKMMTYMMPLLSVWFGFIMPLGITVYWIAQSVFGIIQDFYLTKHYAKIYDAEDEVKRQLAAKKAEEEAEKERIRAARRAANPDGIVGNTSKKKQQLREKQERESATKKFEAQKRAELPEEDSAPVDTQRPFSRGRAYDPNRYGNSETPEE
ncbi:MAG: YidC/Oxa1 family membrane protein insertase [Oscillospiraceae bacterium]|jgi:YidC/Oxa1 family membrane protein insertase|nr:YidC/Oxa1 family membrane protein insertase [Oscillospiraceae bacterium]